MGQYYMAIIGDAYGLNCKVFDRSVNHEYTFAKLMEHSWWQNPFVNAFSEFLYNKPSRVAWVGDYADEPDDFHFPHCSAFYVPCYKEVWGETVQVGFFDDVYYQQNQGGDFGDLDTFFGLACSLTLSNNRGGIMRDHGVVSDTGFGDGSYPLYIGKNIDGKIVAASIIFIDDEELEDF